MQVVLDRESINNYTLIITATDGGTPLARSATANVTILINDENDNSPRFTSGAVLSDTPVTVPEVNRLCSTGKVIAQWTSLLFFCFFFFFFFFFCFSCESSYCYQCHKNIATFIYRFQGEHECMDY